MSEIGFGKYQIEFDGAFVTDFNAVIKRARLSGKFCQNALNFVALFAFEHLDFVVRLDHTRRLDKHR